MLVTGDLLTHPRGEPKLRELTERLGPSAYAVLGNHGFGDARDPLAARQRLENLTPVRLLRDESVELELRGRTVQVVGVDLTSYRAGRANPGEYARESADARILLCHYPQVFDVPSAARYHLVLAGICTTVRSRSPTASARCGSHWNWRYTKGLYLPARLGAPRLAGTGNDVRPVPVLRTARGDGARAALPT